RLASPPVRALPLAYHPDVAASRLRHCFIARASSPVSAIGKEIASPQLPGDDARGRVAARAVSRRAVSGARLEGHSVKADLMRILQVVHGFPPAAEGGTELYARAHARTLRGTGDHALVFTRG